MKKFLWNNNVITWKPNEYMRAIVESETCEVPEYIKTGLRIMIYHDIKKLVMDDDEINDISENETPKVNYEDV